MFFSLNKNSLLQAVENQLKFFEASTISVVIYSLGRMHANLNIQDAVFEANLMVKYYEMFVVNL